MAPEPTLPRVAALAAGFYACLAGVLSLLFL